MYVRYCELVASADTRSAYLDIRAVSASNFGDCIAAMSGVAPVADFWTQSLNACAFFEYAAFAARASASRLASAANGARTARMADARSSVMA